MSNITIFCKHVFLSIYASDILILIKKNITVLMCPIHEGNSNSLEGKGNLVPFR